MCARCSHELVVYCNHSKRGERLVTSARLPPVDLLVKSWTGWHSRLRLPMSSCPDSSCVNQTKEPNQTVGREACGCGCVWVTIWVCIKVFRNKAGLTCKGGRRRQLPPRREFPPPLIVLLAVSIIHTNNFISQQLHCCSGLLVRIVPVNHGGPGCNETPAHSLRKHTRSPSPPWAEMHLPATLSLVAFPISKLRS